MTLPLPIPGLAKKPRWSIHGKILGGLLLGAVAGLAANLASKNGLLDPTALGWFISHVTRPLGQIFLNMLFMVVVPIVFSSLSLGVAKLGDVGQLGRLSMQTFSYFLLTTLLAALVGLALVNVFQPGRGFDPEAQAALLETFQEEASQRVASSTNGLSIDMLVEIVSRNPIRDAADGKMLPVIFFSGLFGAAMMRLRRPVARTTTRVVEGIGEAMVVIVGFAMRLAPYAVTALLFNVTARLGLEVLERLGMFTVLVLVGYSIHLFVNFSLLLWGLGYSPAAFFRRVSPVMVTAFSTSSSNATLPTSIKHAEQDLGVPPHIAGFVLPLGATTNMNGTALFEAVVVLFLAQIFGVTMPLLTQLTVIVLVVLTAIGAAGVPSGSIPLLVGVLQTVGVPGEGIAIIIGVDRILDMGRTVVNVTGDLTAACFVSRLQGIRLK